MKNISKTVLPAITVILLAFLFTKATSVSSGGNFPPKFRFENGNWYDSWGFRRDYYGGTKGYMPNIAYETLGTNKELAYSIGKTFEATYESKIQRAEQILRFVQRWTDYGFDSDNVVIDGKEQEEWAWNADEMAHMFNTTTNTIAIGDCEDMAFLCATIYLAANIDTALVIAPSHAALLIWLPEYSNANNYWDIPNDDREYGWIWVESTGENNPLGWTPSEFSDGDWEAYPLGIMIWDVTYTPSHPQEMDEVVVQASVISAKSEIMEVSLNYSIKGGTSHTTRMVSNGSLYEGHIPPLSKGSIVTFHISAVDNDGILRMSEEKSLVIGYDSWLPTIDWDLLLVVAVVLLLLLILFARR